MFFFVCVSKHMRNSVALGHLSCKLQKLEFGPMILTPHSRFISFLLTNTIEDLLYMSQSKGVYKLKEAMHVHKIV